MKFKKHAWLRTLLIFFIGTAVLAGAETGGLFYLNNVYLHENDHYTVTRLTSSSLSSTAHHAAELDSSAQDISVSHDGDYLAYLENGQINIIDMTSGKTSSVPSVSGRSVLYFKWVYDRDRLSIVETNASSSSSSSESGSSSVSLSETALASRPSRSYRSLSESDSVYAELYSYSLSDNSIQLVRDYMDDTDIKISLGSSTDTISAMDMSTETVVTYLKITSSSGYSRLWEVNVTVRNAAVSDLATHDIGNIQVLRSSDGAFYEDKTSGYVYLYKASKETSTLYSINGQKNLCLLGTDSSDDQYFGTVTNGKVTAILYGDPSGSSWKTLSLASPVDASAISVAYSGAVYVNDASSHVVKELTGNTSTSYKGTLLAVYDGGFYTISDGKVKDHPVEGAGTASSSSSSSSDSETSSGTSSSSSSSS